MLKTRITAAADGLISVDGVPLLSMSARRRVELQGKWYVMSGSPTGKHSLLASVTDANRLLAHWRGYTDDRIEWPATRISRYAPLIIAEVASLYRGRFPDVKPENARFYALDTFRGDCIRAIGRLDVPGDTL